jgi:phosphoglycerate dehydrogenase-like enzyme
MLVPHMGGPTIDRRKATTEALLEDIANFLDGKSLKHEISMEYAMRMTR